MCELILLVFLVYTNYILITKDLFYELTAAKRKLGTYELITPLLSKSI